MMATSVPHNWLSAAEKFSNARFPERGRPLEGSKNLRLVMLDGQFNAAKAVYAVRFHNSYIGIYRREIMSPIWSMCGWDSVTTKRHVNGLNDTYVYSRNDVLFSSSWGQGEEYIIDYGKYYLNRGDKLWELDGPYDTTAREMRPVTRVPVYRGVPKSRDIMVQPKAGDMFSIGDATYVWTRKHWLPRVYQAQVPVQDIVLMRYHGKCTHGMASWSNEEYAYLSMEPGMSDLPLDNILWLATATRLIDRGAKPAKPFNGEPHTSNTINFQPCEPPEDNNG
jgi:hypothetical protein